MALPSDIQWVIVRMLPLDTKFKCIEHGLFTSPRLWGTVGSSKELSQVASVEGGVRYLDVAFSVCDSDAKMLKTINPKRLKVFGCGGMTARGLKEIASLPIQTLDFGTCHTTRDDGRLHVDCDKSIMNITYN